MIVSVVLDPSAFNENYFDETYTYHAEDLLRGILRNGLLIVDSEEILRKELKKKIMSLPSTFGQQIQTLFAELLKSDSTRIIACCVASKFNSKDRLIDLALQLRRKTDADTLFASVDSVKTLISEQEYDEKTVPLSDYRDSEFEKIRQNYDRGFGAIDKLCKSEVDEIFIRSIRFTKSLRFYDPYIGRGNNTDKYYKAIVYILTLWEKHGYFASERGIESVELYACKGRNIRKQHQNIINEIITPLKKQFPWLVKFSIKVDYSGESRIFHARYLESQYAIIRVDKGFDLFNENDEFKRNLISLNMEENIHLEECRDLQDASV